MRELTILFSDIRDFTSISEKLTPDELTTLLNNFLTPATDVLLRSEATIDKYIGDAIVAFWNAPLDIDDHRRKACLGALGVLDALERAQPRRAAAQLRVGIGLNSGVCCVGNFGSAQRFSYSAIGDSMNLASRVESLTKQYKVPILVTEDTQRRRRRSRLHRGRPRARHRPHAAGADLHAARRRLRTPRSGAFWHCRAAHDAFLAAYRAQDFDAADRLARDAKALAPPSIARPLRRLRRPRSPPCGSNRPAPDWDGVFVARQK